VEPSAWRQELLLESEADQGPSAAADYQYKLPVPGAVEIPELRVRIEAQVIDTGEFPERERGQLLNLELMPAEFLIRNWRAGDRYWPAHTSTEKKVKELLGDRHATGARKKLWPVATAKDADWSGCATLRHRRPFRPRQGLLRRFGFGRLVYDVPCDG